MPDEGTVERMNRTIKDTIVRRYHYADHQHLAVPLELLLSAYNHSRGLTTLERRTPRKYDPPS